MKPVRELGRGSHGVAMLVEYEDRIACLKEGLKGAGQTASFQREGKLLRIVDGAGGAPRLIHMGEDYPFLLTNFPTFLDLLNDGGITSQLQALRIFGGSAKALAEVHQTGVIHCDFKMDNLLVDPVTSRVHLIDFGLAAKTGRCPNHFQGKDPARHHLFDQFAPEVWAGGAVTPAADIYSLGILMKETICLMVENKDIEAVDPRLQDVWEKMTH